MDSRTVLLSEVGLMAEPIGSIDKAVIEKNYWHGRIIPT